MNRRALLAAPLLAGRRRCCRAAPPLDADGQDAGFLDADNSVDLWGIVKGAAQVAMVAEPGLGPLVGAAIVAAHTQSADAGTGSVTAAASAASPVARANALLMRTASVVTVAPNATVAAEQVPA